MATPAQLRSAVEGLFQVVPDRSTGDELVFICTEPGCGDVSGNRSVNLRTGKTSCWRCNKGGDFIAWAKRLGHEVDLGELPAPTISEVDTMVNQLGELRKPAATSYIPSVKLPDGFTTIESQPKSAYSRLIGEMAVRKHLTFDDFVRAGVGFTRTHPVWEPYAIFPILEWNRPVYWQGRTYTDPEDGGSTKRFPLKTECPMGSRHWVYNIDALRSKPGATALVVEAILNVLSLKVELARRHISNVVPVAVFKHRVSPEQQRKILACRPNEVCMMFDSDATSSAVVDANYMMNSCASSVAELTDNIDPNDDAVRAVDLFLKRKPFGRFSSLTI